MANKTSKEKYQNTKTGKVEEIDVEVDESGHTPMYQYRDGAEWKAVPKWSLNLVNSSEFFASAHEPRVKFTRPPLEADSMPYKVM